MEQILQRVLVQDWELVGVAGLWGQWLVSTISRWRFRGLRQVTGGGLMRKSWVDGSEERMWKPSLRICLEARIISGGEGKVMGVIGGVAG